MDHQHATTRSKKAYTLAKKVYAFSFILTLKYILQL